MARIRRASSRYGALALVLLLITGALWWMRKNPEPAHSGIKAHDAGAPRAGDSAAPVKGSQSVPTPAADSAHRLKAGLLEPWLNSKGRNTKALISAFILTGESAFLPELEDRIAEDPDVSVVLALATADPARALAYLKSGKELFPEYAPISLLMAGLFSMAGESDGAAEVAAAVSGFPRGSPPFDQIRGLTQEALLATGHSIGDTLRQAGGAYNTFEADYFSKVAHINAVMRSTFGTDTDEGVAVRVGFAIHVGEGADFTSMAGMTALQMERATLRDLAPEIPYGDTGLTVGERLAALDSDAEFVLKTLQSLRPYLQNAPEEIQQTFRLKLETLGSTEAWRWLDGIAATSTVE